MKIPIESVGSCGEVNNKHLCEVIKELVVYWTTALPRAMREILLVQRTTLESASQSSASLAAARYSSPLTYRLGKGNLHVPRAVCISCVCSYV